LTAPTAAGFIGRYQVLEKIGDGGMGSLYLARDPAIDRLVAIKLLRRGFDTDPLRERFAREARAAGRLRHTHIVTIFDVGEHEGDPFIAMEFLAGETLAELIRQGARLSLSRRLELIEELCDGLAYAHRAGLVHRDIKPANLMVDADGVLKILDFGIVRVDESGITQSGVLVGTINYMAPEQVLGTGVDHRSDIFAVGLVAYELLSGRQAFPGSMRDGLLHRIPSAAMEPLARLVPGLDSEVIAIVEQAVRKDPADRYQDLVRMRNDLARVRIRIKAAEEKAATDAVAGAGETAFISAEPTVPGVVLEPPHATASALAVDAERALAEGNYRVAMTIAGRSAAIDPVGRHATGIVARAEAGLLERGRSLETISGVITPGGGVVPRTPGTNPSSGSPPSTAQMGRGNTISVAVAVLALIVAAVALWPRLRDNTPPISAPAPTGSAVAAPNQAVVTPPSTTPAQPASPPATAPVEPAPQPQREPAGQPSPRQTTPAPGTTKPSPVASERERRQQQARAERPSLPPAPASKPEPPPAPPVAAPVPVGGNIREPRRTHYVPPEYPPSAAAAGLEGTVGIELIIGREGRVADARVVKSVSGLDDAALAAVRQWEFEPSVVDGRAVPVIHTVTVPFTAPPRPKPQPLPEASPVKPAPPPPAVSKPAETPKLPPAPTPAELREQAMSGVREALRRFEAAWESLDQRAIARAQVLSAAESEAVRRMIADAESYSMDVMDPLITLDADNRAATVSATIVRRFRPRIGTAQQSRVNNTLRLERRGDAWMIVSVR
jgi:TonB family protein